MTVADFIARLQELPPDAVVAVDWSDDDCDSPVTGVELLPDSILRTDPDRLEPLVKILFEVKPGRGFY